MAGYGEKELTVIGSDHIDVERLARSLPLHLISVLVSSSGHDVPLTYILRGIRLLHSLFDLGPRHVRLEQILFEEVKISEQILDLVFYMLLVLAHYGQEHHFGTSLPLLHSTLVACSLHLLTDFISSQWQDLVQVLLAHPKVDIFMDAAFDAVRVDIRFFSVKLSALNTDVLRNRYSLSAAERTGKNICQQCEAALQFIMSVCQQSLFRDRLLNNKELCRNGGVLSLAQAILSLSIPRIFNESSDIVDAISRLKSKVLAILLQLCGGEHINYLDEVAGSPKSMDLAKSVVLEILNLLKAAFSREAKQLSHCPRKCNPKGLVFLYSMQLANVFSDDSNFKSFFISNINKVLAEILAMPHEEFFSSWCSTDVWMMKEDSILVYDPFVASGTALASFTSDIGITSTAPVLLNKTNSVSLGSLSSMPCISYLQQRTSYLVKILANLHCFVPIICEEEEKDLLIKKIHECLQLEPSKLSHRFSTIQKNSCSLSVYAESLIPDVLLEEDVQLLSDFYKKLLASIPSLSDENPVHEQSAEDIGDILDKNAGLRAYFFSAKELV